MVPRRAVQNGTRLGRNKRNKTKVMRTLTTTQELADFCTLAQSKDFVTVDTEFLRERSYYSKLCLVQLALPGTSNDEAVLVDPLAEGLSLAPLYALFEDESTVKVFHAARQDIEIFCLDAGVIPKPLFDTQLAAMVCGFGQQVGYETLVNKITKKSLDKSSRFTDWSRRPLSEAQKKYALADVTHLRQIYEYFQKRLKETGRAHWVQEELAILLKPDTYIVQPDEAWKRIKVRSHAAKFLANVYTLATFREEHAQKMDIPRNRVFKDDALVELASTRPQSIGDLGKSRMLLRDARKGAIAEGILKAIQTAADLPKEQIPKPAPVTDRQTVNSALADLLRVMLKAVSERTGVAAKLIATSSDLDRLASGDEEVNALTGWRFEIFGREALRLCRGETGLRVEGKKVVSFPIVK